LYYFNSATNQSTYSAPATTHPKEEIDRLCFAPIEGKNLTPPGLVTKRDYFFKGLVKLYNIEQAKVADFRIDEVASFSVSESNVANAISLLMLKHLNNNKALTVCDGMACVGGNTISFSYHFDNVLSNEFDYGRYHMLVHNVRGVLGRRNVRYFNRSITDLICMYDEDAAVAELDGKRARPLSESNNTATGRPPHPACDVLFLDPEWGGVDYKTKGTKLKLLIGPVGVDEFVERTLENNPGLSHICLKLPLNFDNESLHETATRCGCSYTLYTPDNSELRKMSLTVISRTQQQQLSAHGAGAGKKRRYNTPLEPVEMGIGGSSSGSGSESASLHPQEDFPTLALMRKQLFVSTAHAFADANSAFGVMQGTTKTARACKRDGMRKGLGGMHARVIWEQHMRQVQEDGDVGQSGRDPIFTTHTTLIEAVILELIDGGRTREQALQVYGVLAQGLAQACAAMVAARQQLPSSSITSSADFDAVMCTDSQTRRKLTTSSTSTQLNHKALYVFSYKALTFAIRGEHLGRLLLQYQQYTDKDAGFTDPLFQRRVFCVLARYETLSEASDGYQMAFPPKGFDWLRTHMGVNAELFASPLNAYNAAFCSIAQDCDKFFGSLGNFFQFDANLRTKVCPPLHLVASGQQNQGISVNTGLIPEFYSQGGGSFEANPPFVDGVMTAMARRIEAILCAHTASSIPWSFCVVVPGWNDADCESYQIMSKSTFARPRPGYYLVLDPKTHNYRPGMQHRAEINEQPSNVTSFVFFLQNDAGARTWPISEAKAALLRRILESTAGTT